ncbi:MAG: ATP-dependent DNA helicase, partial [Planctomycetaceae bacterium]|nr:ATP-dependent DNA helicase [Planctomycetaceae bacterium]
DRQRHDRRVETVLAMLHRYDVIDDAIDLSDVRVKRSLPESLADAQRLSEKLLRDQKKLYALVQYVQEPGDRMQFIHRYFGVPCDETSEDYTAHGSE